MKKVLLDILFALTHPRYWLRNEATSKTLDKWYDKKITSGTTFTNVNTHTASFCGKRVWIANQPYACFVINNKMPKRRTVARLGTILMESILNEEES